MEPFDADRINPANWSGFRPVRKKPITVHACQINLPEGFVVTTMEGRVVGQCGDYLMIGVRGEKYPIARGIFEESYDFMDEPAPSSEPEEGREEAC